MGGVEVTALTILTGALIWFLKYTTRQNSKREEQSDIQREKRENKRDTEQKEERDYYRKVIDGATAAQGAETDFVPANTLSNLDAQYDSVIIQPIPNTTPLKIKSYAAATVIEAQVANQSGVAGNTIYLFGILY